MKRSYLLVTNNPKVKKQYKNIFNIKYCDNLNKVMITTRDYIHSGYKLTSHPLAGSVKPVQNPYRSIILESGDCLDYNSLDIMEKAIYKVKQFKENKKNMKYPVAILKDYQEIDYTLISSGLKKL